ncbi:MAG: DUF7504 family protein [Halobacteriota archaeon]
MRSEGGNDQSAHERAVSLVRELDSLKRNGSNLLVVGSSRHVAHPIACRSFLGDSGAGPRTRLFVVLENGTDVASRLPEHQVGPTSADIGVVQCVPHSRSTAVSIGRETEPSIPDEAIESTDSLAELGIEISAQIERLDDEHGGLPPAALRVCVDSLAPLFERHGDETVFRFLHLLNARIRTVNGMGHVHVPVDRDSEYVRLIEPLFDATIEVRQDDHAVLQRWHLRESGLSTDWLHVD